MRRGTLTLIVLAGLAAAAALAWLAGGRLTSSRAPADDAWLAAAIAGVEAGRATTPLVRERAGSSEVDVIFLAQDADGVSPRIVSDATGWGEQPGERFSFAVGRMARVERTDQGGRASRWYFLTTRVARGARIEYLLAYTPGDYRIDPHNPRRARFRPEGSPASEFVVPGYVPPPGEPVVAADSAGNVAHLSVESAALSGAVPVVVYTPPGYRRDHACPVVVFHDRLNWGREGDGPRLLDRLIADGRIEPVIAVFADSGRPGDENVPAVRTFLGEELPQWLGSRYNVTGRAEARVIVGASYGARDALEAATGRGAAYGRVALLIPGRRLRATDVDELSRRPSGRLRIAILAARYDAPNLATARSVRAVFASAGHQVHYVEVSEGHNAATWHDHAGEILTALLPPR